MIPKGISDQKALKDEYFSDSEVDEFEQRFKEAHEDNSDDKGFKEEESNYSEDSRDSMQRSLEDNPIQSEEYEEEEEEYEEESDEISLEV